METCWTRVNQGCFAIENYNCGTQVKKLQGNWAIVDSEAGHMAEQLEGEVKNWLRQVLQAVGSSQGMETRLARSRKELREQWPSSSPTFFSRMTRIRKPLGLCRLDALVIGPPGSPIPVWTCKGRLPTGQFGPYMYPFVKSKPFSGGGGHICDKPCHICMRKVVPFRKAAPSIEDGRSGNSNSHRHYRGGLVVWQLKKMMPHFRRNLTALRAPSHPEWLRSLWWKQVARNPSSIRCSPDVWASWVIAPSASLRCKGWLATTQEATITVDTGRSVRGWPATYQKNLSVQRLRRRLQSSCLLRFASFGNLVVQAKSLVIGGLLSMISAICLSTHEESNFSRVPHIEISSSLTTGQSEIVVWNEVCRRPTTGFASCACVIAVCGNVY